MGEVLGRPTVLPVPRIALRVALGEFASDVLSSAHVSPAILTGAGFAHEHHDIAGALRWALGVSHVTA